ncbi:MAG: hypothetical protein IT239_00220, partial [Bacteroidia bacterium]|nr:hypothetical protein [Bacteroidia bacterium]
KHNPKNDLPNAGFNELVKLGFTNQTAHVFHLISTRFAFWALIQFSGTDTTGIFSNAIQIAEAVWVITNSFATVQYAKISNSTNHNNSIKLTNLLGRVTFVITALILTGVNLLPESFYLSLFGQDFIGIKLPLFILSIGTIFFNWMLIYGHYFSGQGIYKFNTLSVIISSVFTVASFLLIGKNLNLINASILTALSYIITGGIIFFIYLNKTHQKISILIPKKEDLLMLKNMF